MKVLAMIDSFKGSITSNEAAKAALAGVRRAYAGEEIGTFSLPLADGGEGTVEALVSGLGGRFVSVEVTGPLGKKTDAVYGIIKGDTAVMEMSAAAGITLVSPEERNPMRTTTYGVGEMIRDAIFRGVRKFIIGIGGSATNDGGTGMLCALGFGFFDSEGAPISQGAEGLESLARITTDGAMPELSECEFRIACDVGNPLCGANGCSAVYGPQKGATPEMVKAMDSWLDSYARQSRLVFANADPEYPGTGAAGGLGFAFLSYLNGKLMPGVSLVLDAVGAEEKIMSADIVITGEGRLDGQSANGKAPVGVARLAKKHGKTVVAFSGSVKEDARLLNGEGIDAYFPILQKITTLEEAMDKSTAQENLERAAEQAFRLIRAMGR